MEINPTDLSPGSIYKILTGSVIPRPIGWISTTDVSGQPNLAPFSYFNVVSTNPPYLMFSPGFRGTDHHPKDTLNNVRATMEFVANIVTEELGEAMNITSTELLPEVNEFELAGLTPLASVVVSPPRVAESPIHFECRVSHIIDLEDQGIKGNSVVIGRVVHVHVSDDVLFEGDKIDIRRLKPIGRLAGWTYCRVDEIFEMPRPPSRL